MSSTHAPFVGFGDPDTPTQFAHFHVLLPNARDVQTYPDWNGTLLERTRQVAGSSNVVTQIMGHGPARMALRVWFDTREDYRRLRRFYGTAQTLTLLAGFTSEGGETQTHLGRDYEAFPGTLLVDISDVQNRIGGQVECTATFQRPGMIVMEG